MDVKNILIIVMGYTGILLIIIGIALIPSQGDLRRSEIRISDINEDDIYDGIYDKAFNEYDNLKWRQEVSTQMGYLGIAVIMMTTTLAILRFEQRDRRSRPTPPPYPYPEQYPPLSRKPQEILFSSKQDFEVRD